MKINIDQLLQNKGKTRYWLAKQVGITYPNLCNLADNKTSSIKFELLEKMCHCLDCLPNDIITINIEKSQNL